MKKHLLFALILMSFFVPGFSQESKQKYEGKLLTVISPECVIAANMFQDLNNDNIDEFLVIGKQGQVKIYSCISKDGAYKEISNKWSLPFSNQSLLCLSSFFTNDKTKYLITLTPDGLTAYPISQNGNIEPEGILINRRIKFQFRIDQPVFSEFLQDINHDGKMDVIVPIVNYCEVWLNEGLEDDSSSSNVPVFSKIGKFPIEMIHNRQADLKNTKGKLTEQFSIPNLVLKDINGDGCLDLVVSHKPKYDYYLLDKDGVIPEKPSVSLDLNLFHDTTPKSEGLKLGSIISNNEPQLIESDLNNDHIPDYIISHMRKFWIFHGTNNGPQFTEPSAILKVAEDITVLQPMQLDEDAYPDLLMLKIQLPTLSTVLGGLFADWKFLRLESTGYKSIQGNSFELSSNWKGDVYLQLPSILSLIKNPGILNKFQDQVKQKYGTPIYGDFNGDENLDVAMSNKENGHFEMWLSTEKNGKNQHGKNELSSQIKELLFTDKDNVWDIDRVVTFMNSLINEQAYLRTGGKEPDFYMAQFKDRNGYNVLSVDFDHDKKDELLFISSVQKSGNLKQFELYSINNK
ncbi:MAG: VCBS repeat-containing protein [Sedimentisphaerales bacterium]|nr:VCBS repeat-containing protein [Sedimentisphaerales bacterium]